MLREVVGLYTCQQNSECKDYEPHHGSGSKRTHQMLLITMNTQALDFKGKVDMIPYSICQSIRLESNSSQIRQSYKDFTSRLALNYFIISNPWINLVTLLWTWRTLQTSVWPDAPWPDAIERLHVYNKWSYFINTGSLLVFKTKWLLWYF